jgi:hypothetical protein
MKKLLLSVVTILLLVVVSVPVADALVVWLEAAAPLTDRTEAAVVVAARQAVVTAMRGAAAMGLSTLSVTEPLVLVDRVVVSLLATDEPVEDETGRELIESRPDRDGCEKARGTCI